jgi:hypothetical protein
MEDTVRQVIGEWNTSLNIYSRLPLDQQPNYNHLMREFTGDSFCTLITITAERKDIVNNMTNDPDIDNLDGGIKNDGTLLYAIHNVIDGVPYKPSLHDIVTNGDGEVYYIRSIRDRIGETLISLRRFTGNKPQISITESGIIIRDYDWGDVE